MRYRDTERERERVLEKNKSEKIFSSYLLF